MIISKRRRRAVGIALGFTAAASLVLAGWAAGGVTAESDAPARQSAVTQTAVTHATVASIPVLVYHEMNNGCQPTAPVCIASDPETVSTTQFTDEMSYLAKSGYHTVNLAQYDAWLRNEKTPLPAKPVLITADNGIGNFLEGAQPILKRDGFQATAFLVTGFAYGAAGQCEPDAVVAGKKYDVQPGCGIDNVNWDLTWPQLQSLNPSVWSFALEAGPSGHFVQDYNSQCQMFDACEIPGETNAEYESRVNTETSTGLHDLAAELPGRVTTAAWVVPYSNLGYHRCVQSDCTPQPSTGPAGWLAKYAAAHFMAVFVEDAFRNTVDHERFRFDVNGSNSENYFQSALAKFTTAGDFRW
jgi:hypothetical protein